MKKSTLSTLLVAGAFGLSACGGGSGSSSGNDNPQSGNGNIEETGGDLSGAEQLLFYTVGESDTGQVALRAVDADQPANVAEIESAITENYAASEGTLSQFAPSYTQPDPRNLPLGVRTGSVGQDGMDGTVSDIHHPWVIYNKPDGHLYRVATNNGVPEPERISSESEAGVVCGAALVPDYDNPLDALLVYQLPAQGTDCSTREWRMTAIDATEADAPHTLFPGTGLAGGGNIVPLQDWNSGAAIGFLTATEEAGSGDWALTRFDADGNADHIADLQAHALRVLERTGPDGRLLINNHGTPQFYDPSEQGPAALVDVDPDFEFDGGVDAANVARMADGTLVIADVYTPEWDAGELPTNESRLIRLDPEDDTNPFDVLHEGWGDPESATAQMTTGTTRIVGVYGDHVAWVYRSTDPDDPNQRVAQLASYNISSNHFQELATLQPAGFDSFVPVQLGRYFPVASEVADDGWILFNDYGAETPGAVAVNITDQTTNPMPLLEVWTQTWATSVGPSGRSAERVLLADHENQVLRSRAVANPYSASEQTFTGTPSDILEMIQQAGQFDTRTALGMNRQDSGRDLLFLDLADGNSLRMLTDSQYDIARPVAMY